MKRPSIYLVEAENRQVLAETFMRFQEHYESPEFKGKVFTADEFAAWYAQKYGGWTYSKDWYGFNIPSKVLEPFRHGKFDPLTVNEQKLLEVSKKGTGDFYIIGVTPEAEYFTETMKHEFVHGAFHINSDYRQDVVGCLCDHKIRTIKNALLNMGYHSDVHEDETNAYVLVEPETISKFATIRDTQKLRTRLDAIFKKHFGFSVLGVSVPNLMARAEHVQV